MQHMHTHKEKHISKVKKYVYRYTHRYIYIERETCTYALSLKLQHADKYISLFGKGLYGYSLLIAFGGSINLIVIGKNIKVLIYFH